MEKKYIVNMSNLSYMVDIIPMKINLRFNRQKLIIEALKTDTKIGSEYINTITKKYEGNTSSKKIGNI